MKYTDTHLFQGKAKLAKDNATLFDLVNQKGKLRTACEQRAANAADPRGLFNTKGRTPEELEEAVASAQAKVTELAAEVGSLETVTERTWMGQ